MSEKKTYSPKLREAMDEIAAVLKKYDCMGMIHLTDQSHGEFLLGLETSWSYIKLEETPSGKTGIRILAKGIKVGTPEHKNLEATVGAICDFADQCNNWGQQMYKLKALLQQSMEIDHDPLGHHRIHNDDRKPV